MTSLKSFCSRITTRLSRKGNMSNIINRFLSAKLFFKLNPDNLPLHKHFTYDADGLITFHYSDFLNDPTFIQAYKSGTAAGHKLSNNLHIEWRAYVACWAANHVKYLDGDYVECGCYTGILSKIVASYIEFEKMQHKRFFLFDSFQGLNLDLLIEDEKKNIELYRSKNTGIYSGNYLEITKNNFKDYKNVFLVQGFIPDSLYMVEINKVCYLSIDMNAAYPEVEALKYFWNKLTIGAIVILDDYNYIGHSIQKKNIDDLGKMIGFNVLSLPTGQGLIIKN